MKITSPSFGNAGVGIVALLKMLDYDVVPPPVTTGKTLSVGVQYSPEFACLPFKITLGGYVDCIEKGASTILMLGGIGPCRFGYYVEVQRRIIKSMGYDYIDWLILDPGKGISNLLYTVIKLFNRKDFKQIEEALKIAWLKLKIIDEIEIAAQNARPFENKKGLVEEYMNNAIKELDSKFSEKEIKEVPLKFKAKLPKVSQEEHSELLKVGIVGEFYVVLDDFANLDIVRHLGEMGVLVEKAFYASDIVKAYIPILPKEKREAEIISLAKPYIKRFVGAEGQKTIGYIIDFAKRGFDGVIHLLPFTCMPEVIAEGVIPCVVEDYNIPVLTISLDEQTSQAGIITRLEAFVDMLKVRKLRRNK